MNKYKYFKVVEFQKKRYLLEKVKLDADKVYIHSKDNSFNFADKHTDANKYNHLIIPIKEEKLCYNITNYKRTNPLFKKENYFKQILFDMSELLSFLIVPLLFFSLYNNNIIINILSAVLFMVTSIYLLKAKKRYIMIIISIIIGIIFLAFACYSYFSHINVSNSTQIYSIYFLILLTWYSILRIYNKIHLIRKLDIDNKKFIEDTLNIKNNKPKNKKSADTVEDVNGGYKM
ncbi:hypothetical protein KFV08_02670 [Macrococcoides canis]|uniref:hypothetical protein n=1 Tax=Macrococcoides canis TaxID=1855823 RepID=UPI00207C92D6|nr:hypothetical protein [Macrococcus canis]MCO4097481.1 hypothetical protein [Macrococcus canis]UTH09698.1 hypothetical protein KFV08_02670 [Macrococcus canis]